MAGTRPDLTAAPLSVVLSNHLPIHTPRILSPVLLSNQLVPGMLHGPPPHLSDVAHFPGGADGLAVRKSENCEKRKTRKCENNKITGILFPPNNIIFAYGNVRLQIGFQPGADIHDFL